MGSTKDKAVTIPHRLPPAPMHRVHLLAASTRPLLPYGVTSHPHGPPLLLLVAMHGGSSLAMVSGMSIPDSSGTQRYPSRPSLSLTTKVSPSYAPSLACARRVTAYPRRCASAPAVAGRRSKEFVKGFPSLPDVLFADVIQGPTITSRHESESSPPYALVGCTTYAHIDPSQAALRAGSYR